MVFANICKAEGKSVDGAITLLLQLIAKKKLSQESFEEEIALLPDVEDTFEVDDIESTVVYGL